jgi:RNA ligase
VKPDIPFVEFPKIARYSREVVVTEKIDGTNGQIYITDAMNQVFAGSRSRWIDSDNDNFGFARWVAEHKEELLKLGPGSHFGEWWGLGIQRRYDLKERRFSLFNTYRWSDAMMRPACCDVVPILWQGPCDKLDASAILGKLKDSGSIAAPGFMQPEGIVIFHTAAQWLLKKTIEKDDVAKRQLR